jgi:adenosine deaminase
MTKMKKTNGLWVPTHANVVNHTHLDCVLRHRDVVRFAAQAGFETFKEPFPELTVNLWRDAELLAKTGMVKDRSLIARLQRRAVSAYREDCFARGGDLTAYVAAIANQLVPLMQTVENLKLFTRHYIEDLIADHTIGAQIRFAPHLHIFGGLSLEAVVEAVAEETANAPIPIKLILCALRGPEGDEKRKEAKEVADLCIKYSAEVGAMDLAGAEALWGGVPQWWWLEALRAREASGGECGITLHLGEVQPATPAEIELLKTNGVFVVGHFLHNDDDELYQECCPHSNFTLTAHPSLKSGRFCDHSIGRKLAEGQHVMLSTDGTTLINTSMRKQLDLGRRAFGWTKEDRCQLSINAVDGGFYNEADKRDMRKALKLAYGVK